MNIEHLEPNLSLYGEQLEKQNRNNVKLKDAIQKEISERIRFKGVYASLKSLERYNPDKEPGDFAYVLNEQYIVENFQWVPSGAQLKIITPLIRLDSAFLDLVNKQDITESELEDAGISIPLLVAFCNGELNNILIADDNLNQNFSVYTVSSTIKNEVYFIHFSNEVLGSVFNLVISENPFAAQILKTDISYTIPDR